MMGIEDKTLLRFCHWGKRNKVLPDGSISYGGGITEQVIAKMGVNYEDFVIAVFDRLGIDPSDKMLLFTVKFDRSELIRLRDQEGIDTLLQFMKEPDSRPPSGGTKNTEHTIASDKQPDTTSVGDDLNGNKCGVLSSTAVGKLPPHQDNQEPFVGQNNIQNDPNALFRYRNYHRHKQLTSSGIQETFWKKCDTCNTRYLCYRKDVSHALRCKTCTTFDLGSQGAACRPKQSQPGGQDKPLESKLNKSSEQRKLPNQGTSRMTGGSAGFPPTQTGSEQVAATTKVACKSRKRYRNQTAESSESDDTSISVDTEDAESEMERILQLDKIFRDSKP
ncbi:hypothetical protein R3W88_002855 [Solanum pinnatisectum]|uniref:Uncharacterized protein n=1 Tax=Solanum pinnatisectum TaxID=50273 RepID=A0AAV9MMZ3_9SOLN|nr:hypothetical protein R3W88_002855 [Solanum pinnatisectum]